MMGAVDGPRIRGTRATVMGDRGSGYRRLDRAKPSSQFLRLQ